MEKLKKSEKELRLFLLMFQEPGRDAYTSFNLRKAIRLTKEFSAAKLFYSVTKDFAWPYPNDLAKKHKSLAFKRRLGGSD